MSVFFFIFILVAAHAYAIGVSSGDIAPDFTLMSVDGEYVSLSEHSHNIVVLIYWEKEHKRSIKALKDWQNIFPRYRDKGVLVFGLTADYENSADIKEFLKKHKVTLPVLLDNKRKAYGDYGVLVYPSTIIIDRGLKIAYALPGHPLTYKKLIEGHLRFILGEIDEEEMQEIISYRMHHMDISELIAWRKYNLALRFMEIGFIEYAVEAARESIAARDDIVRTHILLGFIFLEQGEADSSMKEFEKALELSPFSFDAITGLGGALVLKGESDKAIKVLTSAIADNPNPHMVFYELGRAYELKGDKEEAMKMYKKSLENRMEEAVLPSDVSGCR